MLFERGDFQHALLFFTDAARLKPLVPEYAYRVGLAHWRLGFHESARQAFERAILLKADFAHAHGELGRVLLAMGEIEPAVKHARRAVELEPGDASLALALASALEANRQTEPAVLIIDQLLQKRIATTDLAMVFARLALRQNRGPEAVALIDRLLGMNPPITIPEQSALHFSAANLLDAMGHYDQAFSHAVKGNSLRGMNYNSTATADSFQNFIDYFTPAKIANTARAASTSDLPIFIIGMPRSGTSLVEQILASHPDIHGAGELNWMGRIFDRRSAAVAKGEPPTLESLDRLSSNDVAALAGEYLKSLAELKASARHITDKMPTNFIYLGLIAMLFPKAKIIHCRRDPLDTCLSCFTTDFTAGYEFSFSLPGLGHFYRQYERIMSHWNVVLPTPILEVNYEKLVGNLEGETRRMVEFINLPWNPVCLQFYANDRFVGTASNSQVRKPLYRSSVGRWRNYEKFLGRCGNRLVTEVIMPTSRMGRLSHPPRKS